MTHPYNFRRITATAAVALAMTLGAGAALAQPAGGPYGPGHGAGPGPGAGPGHGDAMIGHLIERAKTQLNLNSPQQLAFDAAVANAKATRESARTLHQNTRDAVKAELAKPEPDLAVVAAIADGAEQQGRALRNQVRNVWLTFYTNSLNKEQKAIVVDMLKKRMAHAESFREHMRERMQERFGGTSG